MSPLARLYTSDGSLSVCSRSGYVIVLMPGTVFVALLCTRSTASMSRINIGLHITLPYSKIGRTLDVNNCTKMSLSMLKAASYHTHYLVSSRHNAVYVMAES